MTVKVGINGFGRIGRMILRAIVESGRKDIQVVAINDLAPIDTSVHLLKYDSVHGRMTQDISVQGNILHIHGQTITLLNEKDPTQLGWNKHGVDIVMECTGIFTSREKAAVHLAAGAPKVIISAPGTDVDLTVVYGVNHHLLNGTHQIISNASCTTNCLAPVASVLDEAVGIEKGFMTTIHAYTGDQRIIDTNHTDLQRARAGALSMIPSTTGAAKALGLVIPRLKGKLDGTSMRVPTPNVSLIDFKFLASKPTTIEEINAAMTKAAHGPLKGVLAINDVPLVSHDFNHDPHSATFDLRQTAVIDQTFCRVLAWYDNEWGFSNRMSDVAVRMHHAK
jgi:glyceraldehyde 3-phosphate dehydrogenase